MKCPECKAELSREVGQDIFVDIGKDYIDVDLYCDCGYWNSARIEEGDI